MASERSQRKLTTILASDVVGYSRLTGADEELTLARLRALRSDLIDPIIAVHHGRVVKRTGDGSIVEFGSVVDAVRCAIEAQTGMVERNAGIPPERRIEFRIGIHLGDVMVESDGDLLGDGVNIAARLEGICAPNGICLSEDAYRQVRSRLDLAVTDLGDKELKNIVDPVHVFSLEVGKPARAKTATAKRHYILAPLIAGIVVLAIVSGGAWYFLAGQKTASVANAPASAQAAHLSIVVLPFANLSGDSKQDYFADGITENLITDLSRIRNSFVIARNTTFTYKGTNIDAKSLGTQLGVRYAPEGSVQRDGNRVRVNAQLIDAESGAHLWADRFEEDVADLFKLQDQIVARIANSLRVELINAKSQRSKPHNLDAVDLTMRGWALLWQPPTRETDKAARDLFEQALKLDPTNNAEAYTGIAYSHSRDFINEWTEPGADYAAMVIRPADRALAIDPGSGMAAFAKGFILFQSGRANDANAIAEAALQRNPNLAPLYNLRGLANTLRGDYEKAKSDIEQAMRLSPRDAQLGIWEYTYGEADLGLGRYAAAIDEEHRAVDDDFNAFTPHEALAAAYALSGQDKEAKNELAEAMHLNPKLVSVKSLRPFERQLPRLIEGLRKAGLPEDEAPRLSIVVLPFTNLSGDAKQDYLADVLTDELTTYISRIPGSFVIASNTAFTYKGKPTDVKEIGKDLGVWYALEGSVQPTDKRIRTNAQLIDTETGAHLWAEEFDNDKTDLLQTQDEIVTRLARTLQLQLTEIEAAHLTQTRPANSEAQELALRSDAMVSGSGSLYGGKDADAGFALCEKALEIDPRNVVALAFLSIKFGSRVQEYLSVDRDADLARSAEFATRALAIDPNNAYAFVGRAFALVAQGRFEEARITAEHALALAPSLIEAYNLQTLIDLYTGNAEKVIESADKAMRLSPRDPLLFNFIALKGVAHFMRREDDKAIELMRRANALNPSPTPNYFYLAAAQALSGHEAEARETLKRYLAIPSVRTRSIAAWKARTDSTDPAYLTMRERVYDGLLKAGMSEE